MDPAYTMPLSSPYARPLLVNRAEGGDAYVFDTSLQNSSAQQQTLRRLSAICAEILARQAEGS